MKIVKYLLSGLIILMMVISLWFQNGFEKYIKEQKLKYELINGKTRVSYEPVMIYFLFNRDLADRKLINVIYEKYSKNSLRSFSGTGYKDEYLIHCYFTGSEKKELIENNN